MEEDASEYRAGGYHPVQLGDRFSGERYAVLKKLGYGAYSTVWLARDTETNSYVALKILLALSSRGEKDSFEIKILKKISSVSETSTHPGRNHVLHFLDHFTHTGPNGVHVCLVTKVLGNHLWNQACRFKQRRLPVRVVKVVAKQLLEGLDFLHRECGIIHTDLQPRNILVELEDYDEAVNEYLSDSAEPSVSTPVESGTSSASELPGSPSPILSTKAFKTPLITKMEQIHIRIIDFGEASWTHHHQYEKITSPYLRAPEVTLGAPWSTPADIFTLGCIVLELTKGHPTFPGTAEPHGTWTAEDDRLAQLLTFFGPCPKSLLAKAARAKEFFNQDGSLLRIPNTPSTTLPLALLIDSSHPDRLLPVDMPRAEVPLFCEFLGRMLGLDPEGRVGAGEGRGHAWLGVGRDGSGDVEERGKWEKEREKEKEREREVEDGLVEEEWRRGDVMWFG